MISCPADVCFAFDCCLVVPLQFGIVPQLLEVLARALAEAEQLQEASQAQPEAGAPSADRDQPGQLSEDVLDTLELVLKALCNLASHDCVLKQQQAQLGTAIEVAAKAGERVEAGGTAVGISSAGATDGVMAGMSRQELVDFKQLLEKMGNAADCELQKVGEGPLGSRARQLVDRLLVGQGLPV